MKSKTGGRKLSFESRLDRISTEMEYFALAVPAEITTKLGTRGPVLVSARVNGSTPFQVSLYPRGGGHHGMRIKAEVRKEVNLQENDRVKVQVEVIDREAEVELPADVAKALRTAGVFDAAKKMPRGKLRYTLRVIEQAAKPETRAKRVAALCAELKGR